MKTIPRGDWAIDILTCCRFEQSETSAGSCILTLIWTDPKVVGVFRARLTGKVLVRGARSKWNRLQPGEGAAELLRPRPAFRKMQGQPACRAGEPSGDREEPPPEGLGGHHLLTRTDARCPAGQGLRHHLDCQPGGVGGETARLRDRRSLGGGRILENPHVCGFT